MSKLLHSMPMRYDSLTLFLKNFGNLRSIMIEEVIGYYKVHELRIQERYSRE